MAIISAPPPQEARIDGAQPYATLPELEQAPMRTTTLDWVIPRRSL